jgi:hypothetical protein
VQVRRAGICVAIVGAVAFGSGCNTSSLTKREAVVYFTDTASETDHVDALNACAHVAPDVHAEPITTSTLPSNQVGNVRFRIDHANDRDIALLTECLDKQPGVKGFDIPDLTN